MSKVFFTSDLHFGHANVIKMDNRPFASVEEMDQELIKRWNAKVSPEDTVYVLGDLIWKTRNADAPTILRSLNGKIILIKGNHDRFLKNEKAAELLSDVRDYADIYVELQDGTHKRCILSHYFIPFYDGHYRETVHLHGHSHTTKEATMELTIAKQLNDNGFPNEIYNVGCMYWGYEPVTLDEILVAKQPNKVEESK